MNSIQKVSLITAPFSDKTGFNFIVFNGYGGRIVFTFISQKKSYEIIHFVKKKINKQK